MTRKPKIGDQRFIIEIISSAAVEAMARKQGWGGAGERLREFCEPEDAAVYWTRGTLDEAVKAAKDWLSHGTSFYDCVIIDRQEYQQMHDDRGNLADCPPSWKTIQSYEVAMDGELMDL